MYMRKPDDIDEKDEWTAIDEWFKLTSQPQDNPAECAGGPQSKTTLSVDLLASMSTKQRGLGIQHPRPTAIPTRVQYCLTIKSNMQYAT